MPCLNLIPGFCNARQDILREYTVQDKTLLQDCCGKLVDGLQVDAISSVMSGFHRERAGETL